MGEQGQPSSRATASGTSRYRFSRWKMILCAVVLVGLVAGIAAGGAGAGGTTARPGDEPLAAPPGGETATRGTGFEPSRGFRPVETPPGIPEPFPPGPPDTAPVGETGAAGSWSPAVFRGGVGFFAGLAMGLALRFFLRMALILVGAQLLCLAALASLGWIDVHWALIDQQLAGWLHDLPAELSSRTAFLQGSLPLTGMLGLGLFTGWRRA